MTKVNFCKIQKCPRTVARRRAGDRVRVGDDRARFSRAAAAELRRERRGERRVGLR